MDYSSYPSYDTYTTTSYATASADAGTMVVITLLMLFFILIVSAFMVVVMWKLFVKAGKPGWAAIVPVYNIIVMLEIVGRPMWWLVMILFVPFANIVFQILLYIDLAKAYGKDGGFAALLIFLPIIGFPMLAFGNARYVGPVAAQQPVYAPGYPQQPVQPYPMQQPAQQAYPQQPVAPEQQQPPVVPPQA